LADAMFVQVVRGEVYFWGWGIALYLFAGGMKPALRPAASSIGGLIAFGGPVAWYLHAEFVSESSDFVWEHGGRLGPMIGALSQIIPDKPPLDAWVIIGVGIALGMVFRGIMRVWKP
jgi:hypothetical protein